MVTCGTHNTDSSFGARPFTVINLKKEDPYLVQISLPKVWIWHRAKASANNKVLFSLLCLFWYLKEKRVDSVKAEFNSFPLISSPHFIIISCSWIGRCRFVKMLPKLEYIFNEISITNPFASFFWSWKSEQILYLEK